MKLRIVHQTLYTYRRPVRLGRHRLVLRPREGHDLQVESLQLEITPAFELSWSRDVFGNSIATVDFMEPADRLRIESDVLVTRSLPFPERTPRVLEPAPWPAVYDPLEAVVAAAYQQAAYPHDVTAIRSWIGRLEALPKDVAAAVQMLNRQIHAGFAYRRREEKGVLTPAETIAGQSGSCRDLATLLLEATRSLGIAARFASGYLDCAASEAGAASTHAWAEIYLPGEGWRGYDPTLGEETSGMHVVTGVSNHPRGVMPVSGSYFGKAEAFQGLAVAVRIEKSGEELDGATSRQPA